MCYESDGLFRKLRAFEQLRKDREKVEAARTEGTAVGQAEGTYEGTSICSREADRHGVTAAPATKPVKKSPRFVRGFFICTTLFIRRIQD